VAFVGGYLIAHLETEGDDAIGLIARPASTSPTGRSVEIFTTHAPEVVYHLGRAPTSATRDVGQQVIETNVVGTLNVSMAARAAGARRVLVVGSAEEYGLVEQSTFRSPRSAHWRPFTPYGASKVGAGFLALQAFLGSGLETIRVRAFNNTGPGQPHGFLVPSARASHRDDRARRRRPDRGRQPRSVREVNDVRRHRPRLPTARGSRAPPATSTTCAAASVSRCVRSRSGSWRSRPADRAVVDPALARPADVPVPSVIRRS